MKTLYKNGISRLSERERVLYSGWRVENANAFSGVTETVESALVAGDYPEVSGALKKADIDFKSVKLDGDKEAAKTKADADAAAAKQSADDAAAKKAADAAKNAK